MEEIERKVKTPKRRSNVEQVPGDDFCSTNVYIYSLSTNSNDNYNEYSVTEYTVNVKIMFKEHIILVQNISTISYQTN